MSQAESNQVPPQAMRIQEPSAQLQTDQQLAAIPIEEDVLPPKRLHLRIYTCCCCVPVGPGVVTIAVLVFLEVIFSALIQEWINALLQAILLVVFLLVLCKREQMSWRLTLYQVYAIVLLLNFIELVAIVVVYLVVNDGVQELCNELATSPSEDERLQFSTTSECVYNVRLVVIMIVVVSSLVYFPLKVHFTLVLRAYWKEKALIDGQVFENEMRKHETAAVNGELVDPDRNFFFNPPSSTELAAVPNSARPMVSVDNVDKNLTSRQTTSNNRLFRARQNTEIGGMNAQEDVNPLDDLAGGNVAQDKAMNNDPTQTTTPGANAQKNQNRRLSRKNKKQSSGDLNLAIDIGQLSQETTPHDNESNYIPSYRVQ